MAKMRLGFDIDGDYAWNSQLYRNLIKDMIQDTAEIEVFLITQNTNAAYVGDIQTELGLDNAHVFQAADNNAVQALLTQYNISIYLCADNELCRQINLNISFNTDNNTVTGCEAILVNALPDVYKAQPKYITFLQFWIGQWNKTQPSEENC